LSPARPLIGISCYVERARWGVWDRPAALVPLGYVRAVQSAGGRPLLIPPSIEGVDETLDGLGGIVFSGGADLDPSLYGSARAPQTTEVRPDRDRGELPLMQRALERRVPLLAVCRGMQLLNVARGGTLEQHLGDGERGRRHRTAPGSFARHDVSISGASRLGAILGERASVASHHHQGLALLGDGLRPVARAEDGTIEGIEDAGGAFAIGILWHPEEAEDGGLFHALVEESRRTE
jgi:putative glutamine amidotransferase